MPEWYEIAEKEQYGRGKEAEVLGQPWTVYRIGGTSSGNFLDAGQQYLDGVPCFFKVNTSALKQSILAEKIPGVILYELSVDTLQFGLKVGDIFIQNDPVFGQGYTSVDWDTDDLNGFVLAQNAPNKLTVGVRLNTLCKVLRQNTDPVNDEWGPTSDKCSYLTLSSGVWSFATPKDAAAQIPLGLFPVARPYGDKTFLDTPAMLRKSGWAGYLPPIKGIRLKEGDRIHLLDDQRFVVVFASLQETGLAGTYVFLERENSQAS